MSEQEAAGDVPFDVEVAVNHSAGAEPQNIVVALDGSRRSARAIVPARRLAAALGLPIGAITVDDGPLRLDAAELEAIRAANRLHWCEVVRSSSTAEAITAGAREHDAIIVMATAGDSGTAAIVGSTATNIVSHAVQPVMLVGPRTDVSERRPIEELIVAVSGTPSDESICRPAIALADTDRFDVHFVMVAPRPADTTAQSYMTDLVHRHASSGVHVEATVLHDPLSPANGLARMLQRRPQSVLVVGNRSRAGTARLGNGSVASQIVGECPVPTIMIPPVPDGRVARG